MRQQRKGRSRATAARAAIPLRRDQIDFPPRAVVPICARAAARAPHERRMRGNIRRYARVVRRHERDNFPFNRFPGVDVRQDSYGNPIRHLSLPDLPSLKATCYFRLGIAIRLENRKRDYPWALSIHETIASPAGYRAFEIIAAVRTRMKTFDALPKPKAREASSGTASPPKSAGSRIWRRSTLIMIRDWHRLTTMLCGTPNFLPPPLSSLALFWNGLAAPLR
jgi:hypothetical protein